MRLVKIYFEVCAFCLDSILYLIISLSFCAGEIPEQLGKLTGLRELDLEQNRLSGMYKRLCAGKVVGPVF